LENPAKIVPLTLGCLSTRPIPLQLPKNRILRCRHGALDRLRPKKSDLRRLTTRKLRVTELVRPQGKQIELVNAGEMNDVNGASSLQRLLDHGHICIKIRLKKCREFLNLCWL